MLPHGIMQLEGTLDQFPLDELIGMVVSTVVTGMLEISHGGSVIGRVFARDGRMYHAEAQGQLGFDALCRLFEEDAAAFCFTSGVTSEAATLWHDAYGLIRQAQQQAQQWQLLRRYVHDLSWVPLLDGALKQRDATRGPASSPILASVDGQRSIAEVADALGQVPLEVGLRLCELHEQGLVSFKQPGPASAAHAQRFSRNN